MSRHPRQRWEGCPSAQDHGLGITMFDSNSDPAVPVTDEIIVHQVSDLEVVDEFTFRECCGLAVRVPEHPATDIERPSPAYRVPYGYLSILPAPGL